MAEPIAVDPDRSALLIMDYQIGMVSMHAREGGAALRQAAELLAVARQVGIPVIYTQAGFRQGYPEISDRVPMLSWVKHSGRFLLGDPDTNIHPTVAPASGDLIVVKSRVSAFAGSDLETILRAKNIETLILFGISTGAVVLSTVRHAADADYRMIVVKDCCLDNDDEMHRCLIERILPPYAAVLASSEILPLCVRHENWLGRLSPSFSDRTKTSSGGSAQKRARS
jgi:nicotinamidase-related amidase